MLVPLKSLAGHCEKPQSRTRARTDLRVSKGPGGAAGAGTRGQAKARGTLRSYAG